MKKMFASDFDNTLYFHGIEPRIRRETVGAILRFQAAGHLFGLCTGRPVRGLEGYCAGLFCPDFIIGSSGAVILDAGGRTLIEHTILPDVILEIAEMGIERHFVGAVHLDGRFFMLNREDLAGQFPDMPRLSGPDALREAPVHGISFLTGSEENAAAFARVISEHFPDEAAPWQNRSAVDICPVGCSKGTALRSAAALLGADRTYGMGDSMNDLPLVSGADMGFTFRTAPKELQQAAAHLIDLASEGILLALEDLPDA